MKWIVLANSNDCRIYTYQRKTNQIKLVKEIDCPEGKLQTHNIIAGRPGRMTTNGVGATYNQAHNPETILADDFARDIAHRLNEGRNKKLYDELFIIMPPTMEGLLNQHLNPHIKPLIKRYIQKNIMHLSQSELSNYIKKHLGPTSIN